MYFVLKHDNNQVYNTAVNRTYKDGKIKFSIILLFSIGFRTTEFWSTDVTSDKWCCGIWKTAFTTRDYAVTKCATINKTNGQGKGGNINLVGIKNGEKNDRNAVRNDCIKH